MTDAVHAAISLANAILQVLAANGTGSVPPITC